jgi:hypothetical protein
VIKGERTSREEPKAAEQERCPDERSNLTREEATNGGALQLFMSAFYGRNRPLVCCRLARERPELRPAPI